MDKYKPEEKGEDSAADSRMEAGTEVGKLARELFGKPVDVTETVNGQLNLPAMTDRTQVEIEHETSVICEASFSYQGCYCAVDILKRENDGWAIYEVKSSTVNEKNMKAVYVADVAYQKYVLEHCGVRITGTYIVSINNDYVYDGKLDLERLFQITDVSEFVRNEIGEVEKNLLQIHCWNQRMSRSGNWDYTVKIHMDVRIGNIVQKNYQLRPYLTYIGCR